MKVSVRKAPPTETSDGPRVVVELWMTRKDANNGSLQPELLLHDALVMAIREHLRTGYKTNAELPE